MFECHVRPYGHVVLVIVWYHRNEQAICCRKNAERRLCVYSARRSERPKKTLGDLLFCFFPPAEVRPCAGSFKVTYGRTDTLCWGLFGISGKSRTYAVGKLWSGVCALGLREELSARKWRFFPAKLLIKKKKKKKKNEREMDFVTELIYRSLFTD